MIQCFFSKILWAALGYASVGKESDLAFLKKCWSCKGLKDALNSLSTGLGEQKPLEPLKIGWCMAQYCNVRPKLYILNPASETLRTVLLEKTTWAIV